MLNVDIQVLILFPINIGLYGKSLPKVPWIL